MDTMSDKKLLERGIINFFYKKEEYKSLSNFWECNVVIIDGTEVREYESGEHCFHGEKYIRLGKFCEEEERKSVLLKYGSNFIKGNCINKKGADIKKMGGKKGLKLSEIELNLWRNISIEVQKEISKIIQ